MFASPQVDAWCRLLCFSSGRRGTGGRREARSRNGAPDRPRGARGQRVATQGRGARARARPAPAADGARPHVARAPTWMARAASSLDSSMPSWDAICRTWRVGAFGGGGGGGRPRAPGGRDAGPPRQRQGLAGRPNEVRAPRPRRAAPLRRPGPRPVLFPENRRQSNGQTKTQRPGAEANLGRVEAAVVVEVVGVELRRQVGRLGLGHSELCGVEAVPLLAPVGGAGGGGGCG
jgi:hypothetical protein